MNWFLVALITPVAHAIVNHFDKYLITRFVKDGTVGTLILFSALFSALALPVIWLISPGVFSSVTLAQASLLVFNGMILVVAIMFYLYAMEADEASYVVPLFQLIPIFGLVFGYLLLGETVTTSQLIAIGVTMVGATLISLELGKGGWGFKKKVVLMMVGSSATYAINTVLFKMVAVEVGFANSLFWDMLGKVIFGVILFYAVRSYRMEFMGMLRKSRWVMIGLNSLNEVIGLGGEIAYVFAALYVPVALAQSVSSIQPAFVFIIGLFLTSFIPSWGRESMTRRQLAQKFVAIAIVTVGAIMLERA